VSFDYLVASDESSDELIFWGTYHVALGNILRAGHLGGVAIDEAARVAQGTLDLHRRRHAEKLKKRQD